ncbi:MAG: DUF6356 family protein [Pseudomonadota bacterium]
MAKPITHLFTDHPQSVDETYLEHLRFAAGFSGRLFLAACAALVHAILPFCFEKTASNMINAMHHRMHNRNS